MSQVNVDNIYEAPLLPFRVSVETKPPVTRACRLHWQAALARARRLCYAMWLFNALPLTLCAELATGHSCCGSRPIF